LIDYIKVYQMQSLIVKWQHLGCARSLLFAGASNVTDLFLINGFVDA